MFKKVLLASFVTAALISSLTVKAQKNNSLRLGIGADIGSTLKDPARLAAGIDARLQAPFGNGFSGILTTGYYQFFKNDHIAATGIVPIKLGLKYFPVKNVYIAGEVGVGLVTSENQSSTFLYSPSVGLAFANGFDLSLKYEDYTKFDGYASQLALRFAYGFKL